ncbi:MAG TPA: hypothetical protein VHW60_08435 [Caulobacteraceae bacterium]|nr:hypothetical protein [Caulobacteraceae bacterium]
MVARLRVFISSPGDVRDAREVAAQTVESVAHNYLRHFSLEPYMWENEAMVASGHFQDAIEPPSQFDIVALILWSRLGTPLPAKTEVRSYAGIDGRAPVTGTEWEYEEALRSARDRGVPDLLVYRSRRPAQVDAWDAQRRHDQYEQMAALDRFWSRHFADRGAFLGAYRQFERLEEFAADFERDLRQLLDRRVTALSEGATGRFWPGSPFRGLDAYDFEHASTFFGRAADAGRAVSQLVDNAVQGRAFLLVSGSSGSGKSSLVRAGVLPRLALPRRVTGKAFLRRMVFRPGDMQDGEDLFDALARVMIASPGEGVGMPELGRRDRLANICRDGPQHAPAFVEAALDALTGAGRKRGRLLAHEDACAVLVVDQLEELFTDRRIAPDHRQAFAALVAAFVRQGRIWIIATLRADFWHRLGETPELVSLSAGYGRLDLLPPGPAQIGQIVRLGAEAAGLEYELGPEDGISLGDRIAEAAAQAPGAMPLLSYLLEQLYEADAVQAGRSVLTFATCERLGGLAGSIATRAESILDKQTVAAREVLPSLLFRLVEVVRDEDGSTRFVARRALLATLGDGPVRSLAEAFAAPDARLLTIDSSDGAAFVRVAHEALLRDWRRARALLEDRVRALATRRIVEERHSRWSELGRQREALLAGPDLMDARRLLDEHRHELDTELAAYVDLSERHTAAGRRRRLALAVGAAIAATALVATGVGALLIASEKATEATVEELDRRVIDDQRDGDDALKTDLNQSIILYSRAMSEAQETARLQPTEPQWRYNVASAHAFLGFAYQHRNANGDAERASAEFAAASQGLTDAASLAPPSSSLVADIARQRQQLAPYLRQ